MVEARFPGFVEFSDAGLAPSFLWFVRGPPYPYRMVITGSAVRVEGRGILQRFLPSRSCAIDEVVSAQLRGTLVIVHLPNEEWWSVSTITRGDKILRELKSRGIPTTQDA